MTPTPYPLLFTPILLEKVWGGDRLSRLAKNVRPGQTIGESWELADLDSTSSSGAGGGAQRSVISNGPLAGRTLREVQRLWGDALLPRRDPHGAFPLLVKFLDAQENLSVQVHPSPAYASAHPEAHLKSECWYILDAHPGSLIYKGLCPGVTRGELEAAARQGREIIPLLARVPAIPGECHNLPSGTVHALGAGVLVAEVQTPSDTTFRLYDWGREGRALHIPEAIACAEVAPAPGATRLPPGHSRVVHVRNEHFTLEELDLLPARPETLRGPVALIVVKGRGVLHAGGRTELSPGTTLLLPAAMTGELDASEPLRVLLATLA